MYVITANGNSVAASLSLTQSWSVQPPCIQRGRTPLHVASEEGQRDCIELLLGSKADVNLQNKVARGEGWEVARMVVGADADIVGV